MSDTSIAWLAGIFWFVVLILPAWAGSSQHTREIVVGLVMWGVILFFVGAVVVAVGGMLIDDYWKKGRK